MGPFEMVVAIVAIVMIGSIIRAKHGIRKDARGNDIIVDTSAETRAETKALHSEIRALKDRIAVLERIATDGNRAVSLDREIEALRDR